MLLFSLFDTKRDGDDNILLGKGEVGGGGAGGGDLAEEDVVAWYKYIQVQSTLPITIILSHEVGGGLGGEEGCLDHYKQPIGLNMRMH